LNKKRKNKPKKKKLNEEYVDFLYIDEVEKKKLEGNHIYVDPGKRTLFYFLSDDGVKLNYTNKQKIKETKRLKYQRLIKNYRDKLGITKIENKLNDYNSKTCDVKKFKKYIKKKNKINKKLFIKYEEKKFRKYKCYAYINRKRSDDNMLNLIEKKFGKDIIIILGDACLSKNLRNFISTPNIRLSRKLKERFKVYYIDEYRTSCLHHKTEERCKNLYYTDYEKRDQLKKKLKELLKNKKNEEIEKEINYIKKYLKNDKNTTRKLHSVLTYKMKNNRLGCINRDYNACLNMKKIFKYYMKNNKRPIKYQRGYNIKKETNLPTIERQIVSCPNINL